MGDQEFDLRSMLAMLKRQSRVILATFVLVLGVCTLVIFALRPAFTASTLILVERGNTDLLTTTPAGTTSGDAAQVDSEIQIASSRPVISSVIDDAHLLDDPEFTDNTSLIDRIAQLLRISSPQQPSPEEVRKIVLGKLNAAVNIDRNGVTNLFTITATADDPRTAANIANALADAYVHQQVESKISSKLAARDVIQSRITDANQNVIATEEAIDEFIASSIDTIAEQTGRSDLVQLRNELKQAEATRTTLGNQIDLASRDLTAGNWSSLSKVINSDEFDTLQQRYYDLQQQAAAAAPDSGSLSDLQQQIAKVSAQLQQAGSSAVNSLRSQVLDAQGLAADLKIQLRSSSLAADLPPAVLTKLYELQQNAEFARNQYQALLSRLNQLESEAYLQVANSRIVSRATPPDRPSFPNRKLLMAVAALGALGLAVMMAFAVENFVGGITSEGQLGSLLHTTVVSVVPRVSMRRKGPNGERLISPADMIWAMPYSMFAESIRRMQIGIDQALRRARSRQRLNEQGSVVMVTSANASEGKSTIALSLARSYAVSGRKTLLIDCDLRKPSMHKQLALQPSTGLSNYLGGSYSNADLHSLLVRDPHSQVEIVLGAKKEGVPTSRLISSGMLVELIEAARATFDITILDTSPVGPVVDALYLAQHADVITAVTSWANTSQAEAKAAIAALGEAKQPYSELLSVLNGRKIQRRHVKNIYAGYYSE